jgi:hypothetical protein
MSKEKDVQEKIKANLEAIMNNMGVNTTPKSPANANPNSVAVKQVKGMDLDGDPDGTLDKIDHPNSEPMNIHAERVQLEKEAKKVLNSVMKFYVDQKYIKKNDYVLAKKKIDEMALSSIMFSLKFTQLAMIKLLEDIDMGNTHPRNFEALATLNNQLMSTIKHQAAYMVTLEEGYKKQQHDNTVVEEMRNAKPQEETIDKLDGPVKVRGTKNLMETIQTKLIEDAKFEYKKEEKPRLTDPGARPVNPLADVTPKDKDANKNEDEDHFDLDDEYFG